MDILTAIDVIESISGVTDESTPAGEAWEVILSAIYARPTSTAQAMQEREELAELLHAAVEVIEFHLDNDEQELGFRRKLRAAAKRLSGGDSDG